MIEALIFILGLGGGYWAGHETSTVIAECKSDPIVITECGEILPPVDATFGSTTNSYIELVGKYKSCRAACVQD